MVLEALHARVPADSVDDVEAFLRRIAAPKDDAR
jgi:hypothetical protein